MKKLIGTVVAAALLATAAFADITMGVWLRALYTPVASDGEDMLYGTTNSWGWGARTARVDIVAAAEDGNAGMQLSVYRDMWENIDGNGEAKLWVKPIEQVKLTLGKIDAGAGGLAGGLCYGSWNWIRNFIWLFDGAEQTMSGLGGGGANSDFTQGLLVEITPIENLYIMALLFDGDKEGGKKYSAGGDPVQDPNGDDFTTGVNKGWKPAYKQFDKMQIGFKYNIDGIGAAKVQWISNVVRDGTDMANTGVIEAAFDLTAVDGLFVTLGFGFHIYDKNKAGVVDSIWAWKNPGDTEKIKLALGASYKAMDNCTIYANFEMLTFEKLDPAMAFGVGADYGIADGLTLNAEFRGIMPNNKVGGKDIDPAFGFLVGLTYNCSSNGYIGIGFQGTTNGTGLADRASIQGNKAGSASWGGTGVSPAKDDAFCWAVPIAMSVYF